MRFPLRFRPEESYFIELKDLVLAFLKDYNFREEQILGIGLGVQGLVSQDGREIIYGEVLNCTGLSIEIFQKYFNVPCCFIHDAESAANSELWENKEIEDAIYLSLGIHLGGAIILNGKQQRGITGKSGTFEHMTLIPGGKTCYCGKTGCAECYCSASALLENEMEIEEFFVKKSRGDAECEKRWEEYLSHLAAFINNLHMVLENTVILGGHVTPLFTGEDIENLRKKVFDLSTFRDSTNYIIAGKCRVDAVSIGAALPFIREFLQDTESFLQF